MHGTYLPTSPVFRVAGIKLAVVSNFDTRLRPLLKSLGILHLFDAVVISAEIGVEKPNPIIFEAACQQLDVCPEATVHVGDDRRQADLHLDIAALTVLCSHDCH